MIENIVALLSLDDWLIGDEDIDIAKGKYEIPDSWKEFKINRKR